MTADSSTTMVTHSGEGGINSPSRRRNLPSAWAQVVRGGGESESVIPRSPRASEQHSVFSDQLMVFEPASVVVAAAAQPDGSEGSHCGNGGGEKKSAWNKPSANGVVEGTTTPVMGAASWPALSESTRPVLKSLSSESSSKPTSDGLVTVFEAPVISQTQQKPAKSNANNHSNTTNNHPFRQRSMKRGGSAGGASAGYNRPPPPPPPPLPPPFPLFDMTYCNYVPAVLDSPIRDQPPLKGNSWNPRPMGVVHDHSSNRTPSRRNNFGPRPRRDGGVHNNGYGGRNEHHDRDWHGTRSPAGRDVHVPQQIGPPPPRGYFRQPHPGPPYIPAQPIRPYGTPMGYEMAAPFLYVPTLPPEPYRSTPLLPQAAPPPMFIPVMDPPLHDFILNQIEYYFSDANLVKDNFLRSNMDEEGWVPIALIAGFRRVQNLTTDVQIILNSLRDSNSVEIQGDKVRRRTEWRKWVQSADFSADSTSQSPRETTNISVEEISIQKLKLEEFATEDAISDPIEDDDHKEAPQSTDSSKLANGE
ncbi:la-related protein 1C-like isoform X2 [Cynara cardunculus var. scolymus]|nr:la-related protein 1C-like isoform X2 [Cynara cardunculus var. scolymus]